MSIKTMAGRLAVAATLLFLAPGCTADDDTVEGKACVYGSTNPDEQCVAGYECVAHPDGARCERKTSSGLVSPPPPGAAPPPAIKALDPNILFLRRLGLEL
jgi:hypothetical protein